MRNLNKRAFPIQTIATRHRIPLPPSDTSPTDFDLIASLLPPSAPSATTVSDEHDDDDDEHRTATLLLLRLAYAQSHAQLASIAQELELLRSAPPAPPLPPQPGTSERARSSPEADRALWTLDAPRSVGTSQRGGPLLDSVGKVCGPACRFFSTSWLMGMYVCSRCSHSQYYLLTREATVRDCGNRCSSLTTVCPR
jgi:hypothetical protein